jgi:hypothetical protein
MSVNSGIVTVGTAATLLSGTDTHQGGDLEGSSVLVRNTGATVLYIGGSDVTADATPATGGYTLAQNEVMAVSLASGEKLYGRVATGTAVCNVLRSGV